VEHFLDALRGDVAALCVGPVTAAPLTRLGVAATYPERYRLGALARLIAEEVPRRTCYVTAGGHRISLRRNAVLVDGMVRSVSPAGMALLRRLLAGAGRVVSREELLAQLPGGSDDTHAVETAMARLRAALGAPGAIQTVVKRGYRLAIDPDKC
jgi:uroporphyrinogen-III synthase